MARCTALTASSVLAIDLHNWGGLFSKKSLRAARNQRWQRLVGFSRKELRRIDLMVTLRVEIH